MNNKMLDYSKFSILAGILIGISCYLSMLIDNNCLSALAFSFGLTFIALFHLRLFTYDVGYIENKTDIILTIWVLIFNIIGVWFVSVFLMGVSNSDVIFEKCQMISHLKLQESILSIFIESFLCGIIMCLATFSFAIYKNFLCLIFPAFVFIICGFEHSITNSFYFIFSHNFIASIPYLICNILGNAAGALFFKTYVSKT